MEAKRQTLSSIGNILIGQEHTSLQQQPPPGFRDKLRRLLWRVFDLVLFKVSPQPLHAWRRFVLRLFGAEIGQRVAVYASARIWAPWNIVLGDSTTIGPGVELYSVGKIVVGRNAIISQRAFICTASHDVNSPSFDLLVGAIEVGPGAWVAAEAFIGPGVVVGEGAVVAARSVVTRSVGIRDIVGGNPARSIGKRDVDARNKLRHI